MSATEISFRGGLNASAPFILMPPGQCLAFSDMQLLYGQLFPRNQFRVINSSSITSGHKSIATWNDGVNGIFIYAIDVTNGSIYRSNSQWQDSTAVFQVGFTNVVGSASLASAATSPISYDILNNILVMTNSATTSPFKFTSNTASGAVLGGSPPQFCSTIKAVNNYLFLCPTLGSRVYWSNLNDPETWPAANYVDFNTKNGDFITALGKIGTDLFIFKEKSIGKLSTTAISGANIGPFSVIWDNLGCQSSNGVDNLPDGRLVFLGSDGDVYITDGYTLQRLANLPPPNPNVAGLIGVGTTSYGTPNVWLRYYPRYHEIVISSPFNNVMLAYDLDQQYWRQITGVTSWGLDVMKTLGISGATRYSYLFGSSSTGDCLFLDNFISSGSTVKDDQGNDITAYATASIRIPETIRSSNTFGISAYCTGTSGTDAALTVGYDNTLSGNAFDLHTISKTKYDFVSSPTPTSTRVQPITMQFKFSTKYLSAVLYALFIDDMVDA